MSTKRLRPTGAATLLVVASAVVALAVTVLPGPASASDDGPSYGAPAVGECRALTMADALDSVDRSAVVDCAARHTARVVAVGRLPATLTWQSDQAKIAHAATRVCQAAFVDAVAPGARRRATSAYWWFWFRPTKAQRSHGARWLSCELTLLGSPRLLALPTDAAPALTTAPADPVARCLVRDGVTVTTCARRHTWRAGGTFAIDRDRFPGPRVVAAAARQRCPSRVTTRAFTWSYVEATWFTGDHTVVCFGRTRR